jgi:hypothetical protein
MSWTRKQSLSTDGTSGVAASLSYSANVTKGNLLVAVAVQPQNANNGATISDTQGNSWTRTGTSLGGPVFFTAVAKSNGQVTVSVTFAEAPFALAIMEYQPPNGVSVGFLGQFSPDDSDANSGTGESASVTVAPSLGDLVLTAFAIVDWEYGNAQPGSGFSSVVYDQSFSTGGPYGLFAVDEMTSAKATSVTNTRQWGVSSDWYALGIAVRSNVAPVSSGIASRAAVRVSGTPGRSKAGAQANVVTDAGTIAVEGGASGRAKLVNHTTDPASGHASASAVLRSNTSTRGSGGAQARAATIASSQERPKSAALADASIAVTHNLAAGEGRLASDATVLASSLESAQGHVHAVPTLIISEVARPQGRTKAVAAVVTDAAMIGVGGTLRARGEAMPAVYGKLGARASVKQFPPGWVVVQSAPVTNSNTTLSPLVLNLPKPVTAGNLLAVFVESETENNPPPSWASPSDTLTNAWTVYNTNAIYDFQVPGGQATQVSGLLSLYLSVAKTSGNDTFSMYCYTPTTTSLSAWFVELEPPSPISAIGSWVDGGYTGPYSDTGHVTGLAAGDLVLAVMAGGTSNETAPFCALAQGHVGPAYPTFHWAIDLAESSGQGTLSEIIYDDGYGRPSAFSVPIYAVAEALSSGTAIIGAKPTLITNEGLAPVAGGLLARPTVKITGWTEPAEAGVAARARVNVGVPLKATIAASLSLLASSLETAAARTSAAAAVKVPANKAIGSLSLAARAIQLASSPLATEGRIRAVASALESQIDGGSAGASGAHATVIASSIYRAILTLSTSASVSASSQYSAAGGLAASGTAVAAQARSTVAAKAGLSVTRQYIHATAGLTARATEVANQIVASAAHMAASGSEKALTNLVHLHEQLGAAATLVNHVTRLAAGALSAEAAEAVTHNMRSVATSIHALASETAYGQQEGRTITSGAHASVIASSVLSKTARLTSAASVRVPAQSVSHTAGLNARPHIVVSESLHLSERVGSEATVVASSVKALTVSFATRLNVLASSLHVAAAGLQGRAQSAVSVNRANGRSSASGAATESVPHNVAAGKSRLSGVPIGNLTHNLASGFAHPSGSAAVRVPLNLANGHATLSGHATEAVTANSVALHEHISGDAAEIASSVKAAIATVHAIATEFVNNTFHVEGTISARATESVLTNLLHVHQSLAGLATLVNHLVKSAEGASAGHAVAINHDLLSLAGHLAALAETVVNETSGPGIASGAHATVMASSLQAGGCRCGCFATVSSPNKQFPVTAWTWVQPKYSGTALIELA